MLREELQNSREQKQIRASGQVREGAHPEKAQVGCVLRHLPFPFWPQFVHLCGVAGKPLPMPRWEIASSSLWVAAWWMALGSWSGRRRMSLRPEREADSQE